MVFIRRRSLTCWPYYTTIAFLLPKGLLFFALADFCSSSFADCCFFSQADFCFFFLADFCSSFLPGRFLLLLLRSETKTPDCRICVFIVLLWASFPLFLCSLYEYHSAFVSLRIWLSGICFSLSFCPLLLSLLSPYELTYSMHFTQYSLFPSFSTSLLSSLTGNYLSLFLS